MIARFLFPVLVVAAIMTGVIGTAIDAPATAAPDDGAAPRIIKGLRVKQGTVNAIQESFGLVHVMGEVVNGSKIKVAAIVIEVTLFGQGGRRIDIVSAPTQCVWTMSPGDLAPFDVNVIPTQTITRYTVAVKAIPYNRAVVTGVRFEDLRTRLTLGQRLIVEGFIRNPTNNNYWFPHICAAAYTTRGRFVMTGDVLSFLTTEFFGKKTRKVFGGEFGPYPITGLPKIIGVRVYFAACTDADRRDELCTLNAGRDTGR